jgi:hypothetical protein
MGYKSYQHIQKYGTQETEGITNGTVYVSYKIDGTNGCVWYDNDKDCLMFGSRKRQLDDSKDGDNQNFVKLMTSPEYHDVYSDLFNFLCRHKDVIIYGEWLVCSTLKTYKDDAWKQFYVFDVYNSDNDTYWNYDDYKKVFDAEYPNIKYIPLLAKLENPTEDDLKNCLTKTGDWLVKSGLGEGIVIKNYDYVNKYGRRTWAKMLTEDYLKQKSHSRLQNNVNKQEHPVENEIIKLMTMEHILKERNKVLELHNTTEWDVKFIPETLNRVYNAFISDNIEIIVLKKFKNATINFSILKRLSDEKVKYYIL